MGIWSHLRDRRIFQILVSYAAAIWVLLQVVAQLVDNAVLPPVFYELTLVWSIAAVPGVLAVGWYHGEKGEQRVPPMEVGILSMTAVALLALSVNPISDHLSARMRLEAAAAGGPELGRIAVVYFDDLTPDRELGYLADALTEDLIEELAQVRELDVISRNGVAPFRESDVSRDSIARALEAGTIVDGTVERVGERIRVSVRLVDGVSGAEFRRAGFERPAGELLAVRDEVVEQASRFLREWLGEEIRLRERQRDTESVEAWALVQRAEKMKEDAEARARMREPGAMQLLDRADAMLARAELLDTLWAEPTVLRATIAFRRSRLARDLPELGKWVDQGLVHAGRALSRDPNYATAHEMRGVLRFWKFVNPLVPDPEADRRLLEGAREDLETAVELDPTLASAYHMLSQLYAFAGEDNASIVLAARRAYEEDAYLGTADAVLWTLFNGSLDLQQFAEARRWCEEGASRFPDNYRFTQCRLWLHAYPGVEPEPDLAWQLAARVERLVPEARRAYYRGLGEIHVAGALARAGLADSARSVLERVRTRTTAEVDPHQELLVFEAYVRTLLKDEEAAIDLLKRRIAGGARPLDPTQEMNWRWRPLQDHPRFHEIVVAR